MHNVGPSCNCTNKSEDGCLIRDKAIGAHCFTLKIRYFPFFRNFMGQLLGGMHEEGDYKGQFEEVDNEMLYKRQDYRGEIRQLISYTQGNRNSEKSRKEKGPIQGRH